MNTTPAIELRGLCKRYGSGDTAVDALKGVDMRIAPGEVVGLVGPSGSGKSTLLKCLGAVIDPTAGQMFLGGEAIFGMEGKRFTYLTPRPHRLCVPSPVPDPVSGRDRQCGTIADAGG